MEDNGNFEEEYPNLKEILDSLLSTSQAIKTRIISLRLDEPLALTEYCNLWMIQAQRQATIWETIMAHRRSLSSTFKLRMYSRYYISRECHSPGNTHWLVSFTYLQICWRASVRISKNPKLAQIGNSKSELNNIPWNIYLLNGRKTDKFNDWTEIRAAIFLFT